MWGGAHVRCVICVRSVGCGTRRVRSFVPASKQQLRRACVLSLPTRRPPTPVASCPLLPRYEDLSPEDKAKTKWHRPIGIIPPVTGDKGKASEPSSMAGFLLPALQELQRLGPAPPHGNLGATCQHAAHVPLSHMGACGPAALCVRMGALHLHGCWWAAQWCRQHPSPARRSCSRLQALGRRSRRACAGRAAR